MKSAPLAIFSMLLGIGTTALAAPPTPGPGSTAYWNDHSLVFAQLKSIGELTPEAKTVQITLDPQVTLSGHFDPGKVTEVKVNLDAKPFRKNPVRSPSGENLLVILVHTNKGYELSTEGAEFMPGDHSSMVGVRNFGDPKVLETIKAVQALRKKAPKAEDAGS